jgi:hypothetical protein
MIMIISVGSKKDKGQKFRIPYCPSADVFCPQNKLIGITYFAQISRIEHATEHHSHGDSNRQRKM